MLRLKPNESHEDWGWRGLGDGTKWTVTPHTSPMPPSTTQPDRPTPLRHTLRLLHTLRRSRTVYPSGHCLSSSSVGEKKTPNSTLTTPTLAIQPILVSATPTRPAWLHSVTHHHHHHTQWTISPVCSAASDGAALINSGFLSLPHVRTVFMRPAPKISKNPLPLPRPYRLNLFCSFIS